MIISNTSDSTRENLINIQKHQKGGLSGKPIQTKSTLLIKKFYKLLKGKIKIIGVGGVDSGTSAYEKFLQVQVTFSFILVWFIEALIL